MVTLRFGKLNAGVAHCGPNIGMNVFDTGGMPLQEILRRWKAGDRTAGGPAEAKPRNEVTRADPQLVIPLRRGPIIAALVTALPMFLLFAIGGPVLAILEVEHHSVWVWIASVVVWLLLTAFLGGSVYGPAMELRDPGLILHGNGFEFQKHLWAWSDIEDVRPTENGAAFGLRAVFRPDRPLPSVPAVLPFQSNSFATDGRPIEEILREWLQRYTTRNV